MKVDNLSNLYEGGDEKPDEAGSAAQAPVV